jgi:hypothetical protein
MLYGKVGSIGGLALRSADDRQTKKATAQLGRGFSIWI